MRLQAEPKYKKADIPKVIAENCLHLGERQQQQLIKLLLDFEEFFDGTLSDWKTDPVSLKLKPRATQCHGRPYQVLQIHLETLKKEIKRLCKIGVLKK